MTMTLEERRAWGRRHYAENRDRIRAQQAEYREGHRQEAIERTRQWKADHPERKRQSNAEWQAAHPDYFAEYRATHSDEAVERARQWKIANPTRSRELSRSASQRRRALKSGVDVEQFDDLEIFLRDDWTCGICHEPIDPETRWPDLSSPSIDHIVALVNGGGHTRNNIQSSHLGCNLRKGARS